MLSRSGSRENPNPLLEFDCGSQSINRTRISAAAKEAAKLIAVVVFPTPPFWFATAITLLTRDSLPGTLKCWNNDDNA